MTALSSEGSGLHVCVSEKIYSLENLSETEGILKFKVSVKKPGALSDQPAVHQSTENCSEFHTLKMTETDKSKRHYNGNQAATAVIHCLCPADVKTVF